MSGGFDLFRILRDSLQRPIQLCIWGARGGKFLHMFDFFVIYGTYSALFPVAHSPPPKGFRSSPYRPDPQVSARPRTEGGWVQNPLHNARVATFAFKAFATMRVPLHILSPPWRGHGPPPTAATENLGPRWVSGRQDPLIGFCVNSYVFV